MILEIIHDRDEDGTKIVSVPLTNVNQSAVLYEADFDFLIGNGVDPRWRLASGRVLERGKSRVQIARLIANAKKGEKIHFKDCNPLNLKRDNLVTSLGGSSKADARDQLHPENRADFLLRNVQLKHTHKPAPWQQELSC